MIDLGIAKPRSKTRVAVAMSGGVDSSVVAALAMEAGYDAFGITLQLYDHGQAVKKAGACCAGADIRDARAVSEAIGMAHYVLDFEARFREAVMEDFAETYARGETPVPCIRCNEKVKFRDLLQIARDLGADALLTGHYVRRVMGAAGPELHRAADQARDQSYFLFTMTREQLDFVHFPLGDLPKSETRAIAGRLGLGVAAKPDSQDICFVPQGRYADVVAKLRPAAARPGEIVHLDGRVLGTHEGVTRFTVGQRRGLDIKTVQEPLFVVRIDAREARIVVGPREALKTHEIALDGLNWQGTEPLGEEPVAIAARVRSARPPVEATLRLEGGRAVVTIPGGEEGAAPGQACVFYDAATMSRVLGGGWIRRRDALTAAA
jgi:tRNA-uridine 2-sulfurtransferase